MRYFSHTPQDVERMLASVGVDDVEALFASIPAEQRAARAIELLPALTEPALKRHLRELGGQPAPRCLIGAGAYAHHVPALVDQLLLRSEFYTAYTPYQPEISQGTLTAMFEFQSMISALVGLEVANASTYDGASACAEAVLMAHRVLRGKRSRVLVAGSLHPEYRQVSATYLAASDIELVDLPLDARGQLTADALSAALDDSVAAVLVQTPNFFGVLEDVAALAEPVHAVGAKLLVAVPEPVALGLMRAPGEAGADIVFGEGLGLTGALSFGGPGFGFFACTKRDVRQMPGRLVGATVDSKGQRGFVLTLATREQHIRREKATSNICTNNGLMALAGSIALALLGPDGLVDLARHNLAKAEHAKRRAREAGLTLVFDGPTFNEFVLDVGPAAGDRLAALAKRGIVGGLDLGRFDPVRRGQVLICCTEAHPVELLDQVIDGLAGKGASS